MKIFQKRFVRLIYVSKNLEELIENLQPWIEDVNKPTSPMMAQVASYFLRRQGSSAAPKFYKKIVAQEIYRLTGPEDLKCTILLAIVDAYKTFMYGRGTKLSDWLSWRIPYVISRYVSAIEVKHIYPTDELYEEDYSFIEDKKNLIDIIAKDLKISHSHKTYFMKG